MTGELDTGSIPSVFGQVKPGATMKKTDPKLAALSSTARIALGFYESDTRGCAAFLTDKMKRALVCGAVMDVMLARVEAEEGRDRQTSPNVYVDVRWELEIYLCLREPQ